MTNTMRELNVEELASVAGGGFGSIGSSIARTAENATVTGLETEIYWYQGYFAGAWNLPPMVTT